MRKTKLALALFILTLAMLGAPAGGQLLGVSTAHAQTIRSIAVEGNRRVEDDTVRSYISLQPGQAYSEAGASESIRTLFNTGLFSDVRLTMRGSTLVVNVEENPIINIVSFEGNEKFKDDVLTSEIESQPRSVLTRAKIQNDTQRVLQLYRRAGRFDATVEPKVIDLPDNRVNVVFEVQEGRKTSVSRINFIGNKAFSDSALRDVISTSEKNWLSWLKTSDIYDPERLDADQELLRTHYMKNGYADFQVVSAVAELDRERNAFFITITVDEGPLYRFGNVDVEAYVPDVDPQSLRGEILTKSGAVYNAELVDKTLEQMTLELAKSGYAFAQVRPRGDRDYSAQTISLTYVVEEGARAYVERINIRGNTRTLDRVIRREFDFAEGDAYNVVLLDRAKRRLEALRYFKTVNITREPGSAPDRIVINVEVEEQPTGELSLGGGYSTSDGFLADVSITERNLLGRGQQLRVAGAMGERTQSVDVSFTEPYFLGRRLAAGIDGFYRYREYDDNSTYESKTVGGGLRLGFQLTENLSMITRYRLYQNEITIEHPLDDGNLCYPVSTNADGTINYNAGCTLPGDQDPTRAYYNPEASIALKLAEGRRLYSVIGYDLVYSDLDSMARPTRGFYGKFSNDIAGLGGDAEWVKAEIEGRYYHPIHNQIVGMLKLRGGVIEGWGDDDVLITDTFFGTSNLVRGFGNSGWGPRDLTPGGQRDAIGGTVYAAATAEVQFPIPFVPSDLGFRGALFADAGVLTRPGFTGNPTTGLPGGAGYLLECEGINADGSGVVPAAATGCYVDDASIRASVGVSVLWDSPFGPLRADVGYAVLKEDYDDEQVFRFGAGKQF
ncbi:outer membrane protein assembly factor BamA [Lutibaculum baratangense]|uniref:outer membrane protein assembly factor BamA n=1 Tax=Lutibaculum baratangense TaxID=1358440 RepID=UPI001FCB26AC|nr:outer membrane protein assembly factor BamA [Lutibaculum baratangense]